MNIIIRFFRDFLDGWIYVLYVAICLLGILLCIKFLRRSNEEQMVVPSKDSILYESNNSLPANKSPYSGDAMDDQK